MAEHSPILPQSDAQVDNALAGISAGISAESLNRGFEASPFSIRSVLIFIGALFAGGLVIYVVLWWMLSTWQAQTLVPRVQIPQAVATVQPAPGAFPVVDADANLQAVVNGAQATLNSYGWVDQQAGVVRIPIARAMTLLLQRGLPARPEKPPDFGLDDAHKMDGAGGQDPSNDYTTK